MWRRPFSRAFWVQLLVFALLLGAGLLFGNLSFIISLVVILVMLAVTNRAPRLADPRERDALRQRAATDLEAARRLRSLLEEELRVHRGMLEGLLPGVLSEERDQVRTMIERRERETQLELENLDDTIQRLQKSA
ncbi:MAG: hypothetical protein DMD40_14545 [Gemmatimonadetes bacterium]|nr:MAG: hypothetical protein DMD40_14545 [Gemmatimonadota bacterium]